MCSDPYVSETAVQHLFESDSIINKTKNVKNIKKLSEIELKQDTKRSWHDDYKGSAWIFVGGLPYSLTEGDIVCVFSQYGEIVNVNLIRDKETGKSKGFCFLCYEDQRSTVLAVDNLNSIKILERTLRVDHVADYKPPNEKKGNEDIIKLHMEGCAPKAYLPNKIKTEKEAEEVRKERSDSREKETDKIRMKMKKEKHKDKSSRKHKHKDRNRSRTRSRSRNRR